MVLHKTTNLHISRLPRHRYQTFRLLVRLFRSLLLIHASYNRWDVHVRASVSPIWPHDELHQPRLKAEFTPATLENAPPQ